MRSFWLSMIVILQMMLPFSVQGSWRTISHLISSNGLSYLSYDLDEHRVDCFQNGVPDLLESGRKRLNLIKKCDYHFVSRNDRVSFSSLPVLYADYEPGSNIIRIDRRYGDVACIADPGAQTID